MSAKKQFCNEFPEYVMYRLVYAMEEFNSAISFADRFWEDEEKYSAAEGKMLAEFERFPRLKDALPKLYQRVTGKYRTSGFSAGEINYLKRLSIFKKGANE